MEKSLGKLGFFSLAFGMIVGVGWITVLGAWLSSAGPYGTIIAFLLGGLVILPIGICYAEFAGVYPHTGGPIIYVERTFGRFAGFCAGWMLLFTFVITTMFEAISVGWVLSALVPTWRGPELYSLLGTQVHLLDVMAGVAGTLLLGWVNIKGGAASGSFQTVLTILLVVIAFFFIGSGFQYGTTANFAPHFGSISGGSIWFGIGSVFVTTPFFLTGFEAIAQGMEEKSVNVHPRSIAKVVVLAIVCATVFYVAVVLSASMVAPRDELLNADLPAAAAFRIGLQSPLLSDIVLLAGLLGLVSTWNGAVFVSIRVYKALSERGMMPFLLHNKSDDSSNYSALLLIAVFSISATFLGRNALSPIVNSSALSIAVVFVFVSISLIVSRRKFPQLERPFQPIGGLTIPFLAVAGSIGIALYAFYEPFSQSHSVPLEWVVFGIWILLGAFAYLGARAKIYNQQKTGE